MNHQVAVSRRSYLVAALLFALCLGFITVTHVPWFNGDSQYYVQAALLWREGIVTFAGALVGDRHLVPFFYGLFMRVFGINLDALSLALAFIFTLHSLLTVAIVFAIIRNRLAALLLSLALVALSFTLPIWLTPATDSLFMLCISLITATWIWGLKTRSTWVIIVLLPLVSGFVCNVRTEALLYAAGIAFVLCVPQFWRAEWGRSSGVLKVCAFFALFGVGLIAGKQAWYAWIPVEKPQAYRWYFALYYPAHKFTVGTNGPQSALMAERLGFALNEPFPIRLVRNGTYNGHASVAESERIIRDVAIETIIARWPEVTAEFLFQLQRWATYQPWFAAEVASQSWTAKFEATRKRLEHLDNRRIEASPALGGDAYLRTAALAEGGLPAIAALRSVMPSDRLQLKLPGTIFVVMLLWFAFLLWSRNVSILRTWLPFALAMCARMALIAFSQKYHPRYAEPIMFEAIMMVTLSVAMWVESRRPGWRFSWRTPAGSLPQSVTAQAVSAAARSTR